MLNRAHWLHRQAEKATRKGNVDEAVKYHKEAADILNQLLQNILDEKVAESLRLQAQLHEKERTILRHQRKKAEKAYRESVIRNMSDKEAGQTGYLLDQLKIYDEGRAKMKERSFMATPPDDFQQSADDVVVGVASKKPKDDKVIIEELQVANSHLRKMVDSLFHELSTCQRENLELKARIRHLESTTQQGVGPKLLQSQSVQPSPQLGFRTFKPSAAEIHATPTRVPPKPPVRNHSPPTVSQISTTTDEPSSSASECNLPPLPPLEMPTFDFDTIKKSDE